MGVRSIWYVRTPDDTELTIIAESREEAVEFAADFCDDRSSGAASYAAVKAVRTWRWVGYTSPSDADNCYRDLERAGVDITRIKTRITSSPGVGPILWEVGTQDDFWCRLSCGVLCGGEE